MRATYPPLDTPKDTPDFTNHFNDFVQNNPATDAELLNKVNQRIADIESGELGNVTNAEVARQVSIDIHKALIAQDNLSLAEKAEFARRLDLIENGNSLSDAQAKDLGIKALSTLGKLEGYLDGSSNPVPDYDPSTATSNYTPLDADGIKSMSRYTDMAVFKSPFDKVADSLKNIGADVGSAFNGTIPDLDPVIQNQINNLKTNLQKVGLTANDFLKNTAGAVDTGYLDDSVNRMTNSFADAANRLANASSLSDFKSTMSSIANSINNAERQLGEQLGKLKYGNLLEKAGIIGELYDLGQAGYEAGQMWASGDKTGAVLHYMGAVSQAIIVNAVSTYAGMMAVAVFGAGPLAALAVVVGVGILMSLALDALDNLFNPRPIDPLVIDLDGDGLELTSLEGSAAYFDLDNDGFAERTGWVSSDDAILAIDHNGDGEIDGITEVFGSATQTGYEELDALDSNNDGVINASDAQFGDLLLWQDADGDGETDAGELSTLTEGGVVSISLNASNTNQWVNGNQIIEKANVTLANGDVVQSGEVLFDLSQVQSQFILPEDFTYDPDVFSLPWLNGLGDIPDLSVGMSMDSGLKAAANSLIDDAQAGNFTNVRNEFDDFLARWAGVENVQWLEDAESYNVAFAFDADEYEEWDSIYLVAAGSSPPPPPDVKGYVFYEDNGNDVSSVELQNWLQENDYVVPGMGTQHFMGDDHRGFSYSDSAIRFAAAGHASFGRGSIKAFGSTEDPEPTPIIAAKDFAFLQKLMGQSFSAGINFVSGQSLIVSNPTDAQAQALQDAYEEVQDYMLSRFLVQTPLSVLATDGEDADLGGLEPFYNLFLNPFSDEIGGDSSAFVKELIEMYRNDSLGTDAEALDLLAVFKNEVEEIPVLVLTLFPEIDTALVQSAFETGAIVVGDTGNNALAGGNEAVIVGLEGNDTINAGDNTLVMGGEGDDVITGAEGANTYVYMFGDGSDTVTDYDYSTNSATDKFVFADVIMENVTFSHGPSNNLLMTMADGAVVTVRMHFDTDLDYGMDRISFADGFTLGWQGIRDKTVADMKPTGKVTGSELKENYFHALGDGTYVITDYDYSSNTAVDTFTFTDVTETDVTFHHGATNDLLMTLSNGEVVTINNHFDTDLDYGIDQIEFLDAKLGWQEIRDKTVADMKPTGTVTGSELEENYFHTTGDGSYVITDYDYSSNTAVDTFTFTDAAVADVTFRHVAYDLQMTLANGDVITINNHFDTDLDFGIDQIGFTDVTLGWQGIRDKTVADMKPTGTVTGSELKENYFHALGDGSYVITDYDYSSNTAVDTFTFTDVASTDVTFHHGATNDLLMTLLNGEVITINNHFDTDLDYGIDQIGFTDVTLGWQGIRDKTVADMKPTGTVTGSELAENYFHALGDGSYVITDFDYSSNTATDTLTFTGINVADAVFHHGSTNDLVITLSNGEVVTINNHFDSDYDYGIDQIIFDDATLNWQGTRDKTVADMQSGGTVTGSEWQENYYHALGDGSYVINDFDYSSNSATDTFTFTDVASTDVTFHHGATNDLLMTLSNGEVITINNHFDSDYDYGMDQIGFTDVTLGWQGIRDKTVADMKPTGTVTGSEWQENYVHAQGDGSYIITDYDYSSNSATDTFTFADVAAADVTFHHGPSNNLLMTLSNGEVITVKHHFDTDLDYGIDQIGFTDVTLGWQGIRDKTVADMKPTGTVTGSELKENYYHALGDGTYTITDYDYSSNTAIDTFTFTDVASTDVTFHHGATNDLLMTLSNGEVVTINNHFDTDARLRHRPNRVHRRDARLAGHSRIRLLPT